jgi:AcrR family transcriptional regulator
MSRDSRQALLDAATDVLATSPRASLADIADAAGVSRATLHRVFPTRADLLRAAAHEALNALQAELERALAGAPVREPAEVLTGLVDGLVPLGARCHLLLGEPWLEQEPDLREGVERLLRDVGRVVDGCRSAGVLRTDVPSPWQAQIFLDLVYAGWQAIGAQLMVPRDAVRAVTTAFLDGQAPR